MYEMNEPWRRDTNQKYSELVRLVMSLATAALFLPILLARELLGIPTTEPLTGFFDWRIYGAWVSFSVSLLFGSFFIYLSAKWLRLGWDKPAGIFCSDETSESTIERLMECALWLSVVAFLLGLALTVLFFACFISD